MIEVADLIMKFRLTPAMAKIVLLLLENNRVTAQKIENELKIVTDARVAVHRIRRRFEGTGITVQSRREVGYWLTDESKAEIIAAIGKQAPAAGAGEGDADT